MASSLVAGLTVASQASRIFDHHKIFHVRFLELQVSLFLASFHDFEW